MDALVSLAKYTSYVLTTLMLVMFVVSCVANQLPETTTITHTVTPITK